MKNKPFTKSLRATGGYTQVLRIDTVTDDKRGRNGIAIAAWHNLREYKSNHGRPDNIDTSKTYLNIILRGAENIAGVVDEAEHLMRQAKVKMPLRKNGARGVELIFSLPPLSGINESAFFTDCVDWTERYYNVHILSAVIHNDETAPHLHVILLPLVNGKMNGSALIGGRAKLRSMKASFFDQVGRRYGLNHGNPIGNSAGTVPVSSNRLFSIGNFAGISAPEMNSLCPVIGDLPPPLQIPPNNGQSFRESDPWQDASNWDADTGEFFSAHIDSTLSSRGYRYRPLKRRTGKSWNWRMSGYGLGILPMPPAHRYIEVEL